MQRRPRFSKRKGERRIKDREPKVEENVKKALLLRARKTSEISTSFLTDLYMLKKPDALKLSERFDIQPFENDSELERLSQAKDASLFCIAGHTKKRPNSITLGRMFDGHVLDMIELSIDGASFKSGASFHTERKPQVGNKPMFTFLGGEFENDGEYSRVKSLILDMFHGEDARVIDPEGLRHVISCMALPDRKILFTCHAVVHESDLDEEPGEKVGDGDDGEDEEKSAAKATTRAAGITLEEIGPRATLQITRCKLASDSLMEEAMRRPASAGGDVKKKRKLPKNVHVGFEGTMGTVFPRKQDMDKLGRSVKLPKALRPPRNKKPNRAPKQEEN